MLLLKIWNSLVFRLHMPMVIRTLFVSFMVGDEGVHGEDVAASSHAHNKIVPPKKSKKRHGYVSAGYVSFFCSCIVLLLPRS